jgi:hypothetical protein
MRLVLYTCLPLALLAVRALPSLVHPSSMLCALFSPMCAPSMPCAPSPHSCISFLCRACHSHTRTRLFFAVRAFLAPLCTLFFCASPPPPNRVSPLRSRAYPPCSRAYPPCSRASPQPAFCDFCLPTSVHPTGC